MRVSSIVSLTVAVVFGVIAVLLVRNYLSSARRTALTGAVAAETMPVVVAAQPVARGVTLTPELLKVVRYPPGSVPGGAFQTLTDFAGGKQNARIALRSLSPNEPILSSQITAPGGRQGLSGELSAGMRAVSLRSGEIAGVGGFVLPGDRVDILVTRSSGGNAEQATVTQVLAENVQVLAVDQTDGEEASKPQVSRTVTVEVTPDQAQAVSLAQAVGQVSLALRQATDAAPLVRKITTVPDLGGARPTRPAVRRAIHTAAYSPSGMDKVQVTRGVATTNYEVGAR